MKRELICWDSPVLIDWIQEDTVPKDRFSFIRSVVREVEKDTYRLAVSTLIYPEVLEVTMPNGAIEKFHGFMQNRKLVEIVAVDIRVAKKAQDGSMAVPEYISRTATSDEPIPPICLKVTTGNIPWPRRRTS